MKLTFIIFAALFSGFTIIFSSCEKAVETKPISVPDVLTEAYDSVGAIGSGSTSLTFCYVKCNVKSAGNLQTSTGVILDDTSNGLSITNSDIVPNDSLEGVGSFRVRINKLKPLTTYFYRFYSQNFKGIVYSEIRSFLSAPRLAAVSQDAPTAVTDSSATISGKLTGNGGEAISEWGLCYSLGQNPRINDVASVTKIVASSNDVNSSLTTTITKLLRNRSYYVCTYAVNRGGTNYSSQRTFTTKP